MGGQPKEMGCNYSPDKFQLGNIVGYVLNLLITYLANATVFGGESFGDLSKQYSTIAAPSSWAFSIWSLIFIGEGVFTVWQAFPAQTGSFLLHHTIGYWWMAACGAQCAWCLVAAHQIIWLAFILLAVIAGCLGVVYIKSDCMNPDVVLELQANDRETERHRILIWWIVVFPFATHFAWVLAASVVGLNLAIVSSHASVTAQYWLGMTSLSLLAVAVAVLSWYPRKDAVVTLVGAWALAAVGSKLTGSDGRLTQDGNEVVFNTGSLQSCATALFVMAAVLGVVGVVLMVLSAWRCWLRCCRMQSKDPIDGDLGQETELKSHVQVVQVHSHEIRDCSA